MAEPRGTTPTTEDLLKLPRWARVAFATRAARRALDVALRRSPSVGRKHQGTLEHAIRFGEVSAKQGRVQHLADPLQFGTDSMDLAGMLAHSDSKSGLLDFGWPSAARAAARAAFSAADEVNESVSSAWSAAVESIRAIRGVTGASTPQEAIDSSARAEALGEQALKQTWSDYDRLLALALAEHWKDDTPVDPGRVGPLWGGGEKAWLESKVVMPPTDEVSLKQRVFEAVQRSIAVPQFAIVWDPEVVSDDDYADVVELLGDLVRAHGGQRLVRTQERGFGIPCGEGAIR